MKESVLQTKFLFSYSLLTLSGLGFLYFLLPLLVQFIVGPDFYIYSKYQFDVYNESLFFYIVLLFFLFALLRNFKYSVILTSYPEKKIVSTIVYITFLYLFYIFIKGFILNRQGVGREDLLAIISSQLVPGFGYLLLLCFLSILFLRSKLYLIIFIILAFGIDFLYQGKIFVMNALILTMFFLDLNHVKFTLLRILSFVSVGFGFLILIFLIRSYGAGESNSIIGVYTYFSEFMGVNATVGWAKYYSLSGLPTDLFNFDPVLQKFYLSDVGHGLAISPAAYFVGNFGNFYYVAVIFYFILLYLVFYCSSYVLGRFCFFIFMYNFVHLLRHGPDIFLYKCILQLFFIIVIVLLLEFFTTINFKKYDNSN